MKRRTGSPPDAQAASTIPERRWWRWDRWPPIDEPCVELQKTDGGLTRVDTMQTLRSLQSQHEPPLGSPAGDDDSTGSLLTVSSLNEEVDETEQLLDRGEESSKTAKAEQELEFVDVYTAEREMTKIQEQANALTMIPSPLFCIYFIVAGLWLSDEVVKEVLEEEYRQGTMDHGRALGSLGTPFNALFADEHGCVHSSWFPNLHALPPLPLVMVALGITLHAPFSFLYHWKYAHVLKGRARTEHWSRRMDQAMIHATSALVSFATSGSWDYFLVNLCFNLDCVFRLFYKHDVKPIRNQIRIAISIVAYTIPLLKRGDHLLFGELWCVMLASFYLFAKYPCGGWSHSVFHIVAALAPPLLMMAACKTPASLQQMRVAAHCAIRSAGKS